LKKGSAPPAGFNTKELKETGKPQLFLLIKQQKPENQTKQPGIAKRAACVTYNRPLCYKPDIVNGAPSEFSPSFDIVRCASGPAAFFSSRLTVDSGIPNAAATFQLLMPI
jgi:hypothetical protein